MTWSKWTGAQRIDADTFLRRLIEEDEFVQRRDHRCRLTGCDGTRLGHDLAQGKGGAS